MKKIATIILAATVLVFAGKGYANPVNERKPLSTEVKSELLKVFSENEKLHEAFFNYDKNAGKIEPLAQKLSLAIGRVSDSKIKNLLKFSQAKLAEITVNSEKSKNNQRYHLVSTALIHVMNTYDIGDSYNAYSCPMVKMKWVQNSKKIAKVHNPYAGGMPHCGSKDSDH